MAIFPVASRCVFGPFENIIFLATNAAGQNVAIFSRGVAVRFFMLAPDGMHEAFFQYVVGFDQNFHFSIGILHWSLLCNVNFAFVLCYLLRLDTTPCMYPRVAQVTISLLLLVCVIARSEKNTFGALFQLFVRFTNYILIHHDGHSTESFCSWGRWARITFISWCNVTWFSWCYIWIPNYK